MAAERHEEDERATDQTSSDVHDDEDRLKVTSFSRLVISARVHTRMHKQNFWKHNNTQHRKRKCICVVTAPKGTLGRIG